MTEYKTHYIRRTTFRRKNGSILPYSSLVYCGKFRLDQHQTEDKEKVTCQKCLDKMKKYNKL